MEELRAAVGELKGHGEKNSQELLHVHVSHPYSTTTSWGRPDRG